MQRDRPSGNAPFNWGEVRWNRFGAPWRVVAGRLNALLRTNRVSQPSRLRILAASHRWNKPGVGRPWNQPARTPALLRTAGSWSQGERKSQRWQRLNPVGRAWRSRPIRGLAADAARCPSKRHAPRSQWRARAHCCRCSCSCCSRRCHPAEKIEDRQQPVPERRR